MSEAVRQAVARGEYAVDPDAVASAMIARAFALRTALRTVRSSEVLVAADRIEVHRLGPQELDPCRPLEGAA
jgi:hypothetical protein